MARFLPEQIRTWTGGELILSAANAKNTEHFYRGICTDSRKLRKGEIFLALKGEYFDGHDYAEKAAAKGAGLLVLSADSAIAAELEKRFAKAEAAPDLLKVKDTLKAYQDIARGYRQTLLASLIAITGSVGKTTTRRMVNTVISSQMNTHETRENENNNIGVPLTILQADDEDDVIIAELGMDRRGEIAVLSEICCPDIAIVTSIGYSHAEYLGSRENILREKMDILRGMRKTGLILLNGEDDYLNRWMEEHTPEISIWRVNTEKPADWQEGRPCFWAENIQLTPKSTSFQLHFSLDTALDLPVTIPQPGKFLVRSALFALASAYALGLDIEKAAAAASNFINTRQRQHIEEREGWLLIDDSYNASSPESVMTALDTLQLLAHDGGRRIACLGGIRELGRYSRELHLEIGRKLAQLNIDALYLTGEETGFIEEGLKEVGSGIPVFQLESADAIADALRGKIQLNDVVLIKGSRYYRMENVGQGLAGEKAKETIS